MKNQNKPALQHDLPKEKLRKQIAKDVLNYLKKGGKIKFST